MTAPRSEETVGHTPTLKTDSTGPGVFTGEDALTVLACNSFDALTLERDRLREALGMLYDKWENGDPCWQDADEANDSLGNAFKLTDEEEKQILELLSPSASGGARQHSPECLSLDNVLGRHACDCGVE